jgi:hypothetical protein
MTRPPAPTPIGNSVFGGTFPLFPSVDILPLKLLLSATETTNCALPNAYELFYDADIQALI